MAQRYSSAFSTQAKAGPWRDLSVIGRMAEAYQLGRLSSLSVVMMVRLYKAIS
jgi:hypothetical protein